MPIFEYKCRKCKRTFEILFRSQDEKVTITCPKCKSVRTERLLSAFAGKIGNTSTGGGCGSCAATSCGPS